jgi:hypothetical protein
MKNTYMNEFVFGLGVHRKPREMCSFSTYWPADSASKQQNSSSFNSEAQNQVLKVDFSAAHETLIVRAHTWTNLPWING